MTTQSSSSFDALGDWELTGIPRVGLVLPAGMYRCKFKETAILEFDNLYKKNPTDPDKVKKIKFVFQPNDIDFTGYDFCEISTITSMSVGPKSKLYSLVADMSDTGMIPDAIIKNPRTFQSYVMSFVNKEFDVTCRPNDKNTHNNVVRVRPATGKAAKPAPIVQTKGGGAFMNVPVDMAAIAPTLPDLQGNYGRLGQASFVHDLQKLATDQWETVDAFLSKNQVPHVREGTLIKTFSAVPELEKLRAVTVIPKVDDDDITF